MWSVNGSLILPVSFQLSIPMLFHTLQVTIEIDWHGRVRESHGKSRTERAFPMQRRRWQLPVPVPSRGQAVQHQTLTPPSEECYTAPGAKVLNLFDPS